MTLTSLILVNAVLAAVVLYSISFLLSHSVRHDRRHYLSHIRSLRPAGRERARLAA